MSYTTKQRPYDKMLPQHARFYSAGWSAARLNPEEDFCRLEVQEEQRVVERDVSSFLR